MFKHVVMWRFIDGAGGKTKKEHSLWVKEHLEALVGVIPEIRSLEVGVNVCVACIKTRSCSRLDCFSHILF